MIYKRQLFPNLINYLNNEEILLLSGPRQAGKTTLLRMIETHLKTHGNTTYFLDLEDPDYLGLLNKSPKNLFEIFPMTLDRKTYLFIDEIQYLKNPSNFLKYFFDTYKDKIKIVASGSSAFYLDNKFRDSLAGRKRIFILLTLSFREFIEFKNDPQLANNSWLHISLSEKEKLERYYLEYIIYGGYPKVVLSPIEEKIQVLKDLAYAFIKKDIFESNIRADEDFYRLFKILAGQIGNLVNVNELSQTLQLSKTAINNYLAVMQKSFHISLVKPFFRNVRKELTKMPKVYFYDLGLRNFFKNDFRAIIDRDDAGYILENAVYRQLLENKDAEEIRYWRTADQKEIDFIIEGEKRAYEIKFNPKKRRLNKYQLFLTAYPKFKLDFVSFKGKIDQALYPWQL